MSTLKVSSQKVLPPIRQFASESGHDIASFNPSPPDLGGRGRPDATPRSQYANAVCTLVGNTFWRVRQEKPPGGESPEKQQTRQTGDRASQRLDKDFYVGFLLRARCLRPAPFQHRDGGAAPAASGLTGPTAQRPWPWSVFFLLHFSQSGLLIFLRCSSSSSSSFFPSRAARFNTQCSRPR